MVAFPYLIEQVLRLAGFLSHPTELGPSRFFQEVLHDSGIQVAGKLSIMCEFVIHAQILLSCRNGPVG